MKNRVALVGMGSLLGLAALAALAAAKGHAAEAGLPKEIRHMHRLVGTWHGKATLEADGAKTPVGVSWACEAVARGHAVSCRARFTGMPGGIQEENDLFGFDPGARRYHWFSVTSMGDAHDHVAEVPAGPTLKFVYDGTQGGMPLRETILLTLDDDGTRLELRNEGSVGGKPAWTLSGTATKRRP